MDRKKESGRYNSSHELKGALIAVAILGAAVAPLVLSYKHRSSNESNPPIIDTEAARRRLITNGGQPSDILPPPSPKPSPSPHISFD